MSKLTRKGDGFHKRGPFQNLPLIGSIFGPVPATPSTGKDHRLWRLKRDVVELRCNWISGQYVHAAYVKFRTVASLGMRAHNWGFRREVWCTAVCLSRRGLSFTEKFVFTGRFIFHRLPTIPPLVSSVLSFSNCLLLILFGSSFLHIVTVHLHLRSSLRSTFAGHPSLTQWI